MENDVLFLVNNIKTLLPMSEIILLYYFISTFRSEPLKILDSEGSSFYFHNSRKDQKCITPEYTLVWSS